jgi:hypothetical protein
MNSPIRVSRIFAAVCMISVTACSGSQSPPPLVAVSIPQTTFIVPNRPGVLVGKAYETDKNGGGYLSESQLANCPGEPSLPGEFGMPAKDKVSVVVQGTIQSVPPGKAVIKIYFRGNDGVEELIKTYDVTIDSNGNSTGF